MALKILYMQCYSSCRLLLSIVLIRTARTNNIYIINCISRLFFRSSICDASHNKCFSIPRNIINIVHWVCVDIAFKWIARNSCNFQNGPYFLRGNSKNKTYERKSFSLRWNSHEIHKRREHSTILYFDLACNCDAHFCYLKITKWAKNENKNQIEQMFSINNLHYSAQLFNCASYINILWANPSHSLDSVN